MKRLKLQKAVLAICLALPITLKISNATNATSNEPAPSVSQIEKNSNADGHTNKPQHSKKRQKTSKNNHKNKALQPTNNMLQIIKQILYKTSPKKKKQPTTL